jgi:hypothetical protein
MTYRTDCRTWDRKLMWRLSFRVDNLCARTLWVVLEKESYG